MAQLGDVGTSIDTRFFARSLGLLNPPEAVSIHETESLKRALELLRDNRLGCVLVVDDSQKVIGIFSERDVVLKVALADYDLSGTPISEVMTRNPFVASMTSTIAFVLNMMAQGGYRHVPIVDEQHGPVGVISIKNIVQAIVSHFTRDFASIGIGRSDKYS